MNVLNDFVKSFQLQVAVGSPFTPIEAENHRSFGKKIL
jgi:hypothetical protein